MRICHVLETAGGGSGQIVLTLTQYGLACDDDVTVLYAPDRAEASFVETLNTLPRLRILTSPMQRKVGLRDILDGWRLGQKLRQAGPFDIIHAHSSKAGALTRLLSPFLRGTVVYNAHAFYSMMPGAHPVYGLIERLLSWLSPCVVCVSSAEYKHAQKLGIATSKLFLIPNGLTPTLTASREQARLALHIDDRQLLVGFVGRLELQKNPLRALTAFASIVPTHPEAHLIMVGEGSLRPAVEAECARLNLSHNVELLGFCDAASIIPAFDCLLCSSDFEALPLTFLEALAAEIPIVSTPVGGVDEAVVDGETGFLSPTFRAQDLGSSLVKFFDLSSEQRKKMGQKAHHRSSLFTAEIMAKNYRKIYSRLRNIVV